jgi:fructokinase
MPSCCSPGARPAVRWQKKPLMLASVVCFGEILWDVLPTGPQPGGAPFNVAVHLHQLGQPVALISRVGTDEPGRELLAFIAAKGLATTYVQHDPSHPTGIVKADVHDATEVVYTIVQPVAWDYVQDEKRLANLVAGASALVYGSLAARQAETRATLYRVLGHAGFRVFDVNLRPPHYHPEVVLRLLAQAHLVKMNHHELAEIMGWLGQPDQPDRPAAMHWLAAHFGLQAVCVTCGAEGALLYTGGQLYQAPGLPVAVRDTIGSGDAFLAALLRGWLAGEAPAELLRFACAAGALVATQPGATPTLTAADVHNLLATPLA